MRDSSLHLGDVLTQPTSLVPTITVDDPTAQTQVIPRLTENDMPTQFIRLNEKNFDDNVDNGPKIPSWFTFAVIAIVFVGVAAIVYFWAPDLITHNAVYQALFGSHTPATHATTLHR
jgi:hypothetical protein